MHYHFIIKTDVILTNDICSLYEILYLVSTHNHMYTFQVPTTLLNSISFVIIAIMC